MTKRGVSTGIQASSRRGLSTSPFTAHGDVPSRERWTKHKDDLANVKLILSILLAYLPSLSNAINRDSLPKDFEFALATAYLPKEVWAVHADQNKLVALKFSDSTLMIGRFTAFSPCISIWWEPKEITKVFPLSHGPRSSRSPPYWMLWRFYTSGDTRRWNHASN